MSVDYDRSEALLGQLTIDRAAVEMAALFAIVMGATAWLALNIGPEAASEVGPPDAFGSGTSGEATAAGAWALAEVAFAVSIIGGLFLYRRLPEWLQDLAKYNLVFGLALVVGARYGYPIVPLFVGVFTTYMVADHFGLWWIFNNIIALALAVVVGVALGLIFGVVGVGVALVGLTIYDHIFANKKKWMFALGKLAMELRLPLLIFRPDRMRVEWSEIIDTLQEAEAGEEDDESDGTSWGIGTADFMLPAGFVAAVATAPSVVVTTFGPLAVVVVIAGILVACARLRFEMLTKGSGAGLPALSAGAMVPYAALFVVGLVV